MKAVRYFGPHDIRIINIDKPTPKAGEILIKIGGAGVCHSDLHVIHHEQPFSTTPFTLGHENAGWIEELGDNVVGFSQGDAVAVFGPWGCGYCRPCQESQENYCDHQRENPKLGGGLGFNGGMAEYMIVPHERLLIPLGDLTPHKAAPLTDAALTPYHAIKRSLHKLFPSSFVVVIGIGGLGHMAIQILKATCAATIIACDVNEEKLAFAKEHGADFIFNTQQKNIINDLLKITGSPRCTAVFDFVGIDATLKLGSQLVGLNSDWTVVGLGGGTQEFSANAIPYGCSLCTPYWGSRAELIDVIELAKKGAIQLQTEEHPLTEALEVYKKLEQGQINGRAVLIP